MSGQPVKRGTMAHDHDVYTILANVAALQRDVAALRQYVPMAEALAARDGHRLYAAIAHRSRGVLMRLEGDFAGAEDRFTQALDTFRAMGTRWQVGRTLTEIGELAQARSDTDQARSCFDEALSHFEAMMAAPDVRLIRAAIGALE